MAVAKDHQRRPDQTDERRADGDRAGVNSPFHDREVTDDLGERVVVECGVGCGREMW